MDLDYFFKKHTIKNGESYFVYSLRFIRNPGSGTTAYYVVMIDSAKRYHEESRTYLYQTAKQALLAYMLLAGLLLLTTFWSLSSLRTIARQIDDIRAGKRDDLSSDFERELAPRPTPSTSCWRTNASRPSATSTPSTISPTALKPGWR